MGRRGSAVMKGIIGAGRFPFRDAACGRRAGVPSLRSLCHYSFAPLGLNQFPTRYPRLPPWALILRRFAAISRWAQSCGALRLRSGQAFAAISSWAHLAPPFDFAQGRLSRVFRGSYLTFELALELAIQTPPGLASFHFLFPALPCRAFTYRRCAAEARNGPQFREHLQPLCNQYVI